MKIKPLLKTLAFRLSQSFVDFPSLGSKLLPSFSPVTPGVVSSSRAAGMRGANPLRALLSGGLQRHVIDSGAQAD